MKEINSLPRYSIHIDCDAVRGPFDWWRHTFAHGGINPNPLPDRVITAAAKLRPKMLRIQLQEYFFFLS